VEIVDAELMEDIEYLSMGETPADRMKNLLGKLDSVRRSEERGFNAREQTRRTSNKSIGRIQKAFKNLPKPVEWLSFYLNDLPLLIDFCEEVQEVSIQHRLNRSQTRALEKLRSASEEEFQWVTAYAQSSPNTEMGHGSTDFWQRDLRDLSAREIEDIADKAAKKEGMRELNRARVSPSLSLKAKILILTRLGIPVKRIAARLKVNRLTALKYSENSRLVGSIRGALKYYLMFSIQNPCPVKFSQM